jgi:hypothetical protein
MYRHGFVYKQKPAWGARAREREFFSIWRERERERRASTRQSEEEGNTENDDDDVEESLSCARRMSTKFPVTLTRPLSLTYACL